MRQEILTFCPLCSGHCSVKATVEDGKIVTWVPDTESGLPSEQCPPLKGLANIEMSTHPDRLKYPQKRVGAKGEGKLERISWDEALGTIAQRLSELKEKYGPECVAVGLGEPKGLEFIFGQRFASAFGTPNVATPSHLCAASEQAAALLTFGPGYPRSYSDTEKPPGLVAIWGSNIIQTGGPRGREWLKSVLMNGAKLVVIDPKRIDVAKRADLWIRLRPGSDGALAMGLLKVVIEEKLYDEDFVAKWTVGFDKLRDNIKTFTLDDVEGVTWVPRQQIEKFARLYAQSKPAVIRTGNAISHGVNSLQASRAVLILGAIMGPVNIPGWGVSYTPAAFTRPGSAMLLRKFPRKAERTHGSEFKWAMMTAYIPYQALIKGILEEKPYPIKAVLFILSNPLTSYPDARKAYKALMKLDFMVVSDIFPTPTTSLADIVLPAATSGEHDTAGHWGGGFRAFPKLVDPPGECWPDVRIINELAKRMGLGEYFWGDEREVLSYMLQPSGLSWDDFKQQRILTAKRTYEKSEEGNFSTPSGKVEIYSKQAEELFSSSPLPLWEELSRFPSGGPSEEYPLLLTTRVEEAYKLTSFKHIASMRKYKPEPVVEMNPETAQKAGLEEEEWVYIETKSGRIQQRLSLDGDLDSRVVFASFGWWFPEEPSNLFDWDKSNVNILFNTELAESATGSVEVRGIPCRVYKT